MAQTFSQPPSSQQTPTTDNTDWLAGRIATLLSHYFQPDQDNALTAAALTDWIEILSPFSRQDVSEACTHYLKNQPRRRPTPGAIRSIILARRERETQMRRLSLPAPKPEPVNRVTAEAARRIIEEAGFAKRFK